MQKIAKLVSVVAVAVLVVSSAPSAVFAQSSGHNWTGAYVGGNVGAGMASGNMDDPDCFTCASTAFSQRLLQLGLNGGYNKQFGSAVVGLEAELNWGDQNNQQNVAQDDSNGPWLASSKISWTGALLGRMGVAVDNSLFYLTAGPAIAHASGTWNNAVGSYNAAYNSWQPGFKAGVGAEFMMTNNLSLRAQYSVLTVADRTAYGNSNTGRTVWTNTQTAATVGLGWHF